MKRINACSTIAILVLLTWNSTGVEAADRPKKLVDVLPFTSVEEAGFWLLDQALDEIGNEGWDKVKQSVKDAWAEESDPYADDWASNNSLSPYWHGGSYDLSKSNGGTKIVYSFQGSENLASSASGHYYESQNDVVVRNEALEGQAAASLLDSEGMNLTGYIRTYNIKERGYYDTDGDGNLEWSDWHQTFSKTWTGTGTFDEAAARAEIQALYADDPTVEADLFGPPTTVDESWGVGSYYFKTILTKDPQAHPKVVEKPGDFVVTITGRYTDVEYGGEGSVTDVGTVQLIDRKVICDFNQSSLEIEHGVPFDLDDNQRVLWMRSTGSAQRTVFLHDVMGRFEETIPIYSGPIGVPPGAPPGGPIGYRTRTFEAKVNEEYLVKEVKHK